MYLFVMPATRLKLGRSRMYTPLFERYLPVARGWRLFRELAINVHNDMKRDIFLLAMRETGSAVSPGDVATMPDDPFSSASTLHATAIAVATWMQNKMQNSCLPLVLILSTSSSSGKKKRDLKLNNVNDKEKE